MPGQIQCTNCGAWLQEEDLFCGECGTPRPQGATTARSASMAARPAVPSARPAVQSARPPEAGWRVAAIVLGSLGLICCLLGLSSVLLFGLTPSEGYPSSQNWLYATFLCLVPIGGIGLLLAIAAAIIWRTQVKSSNRS